MILGALQAGSEKPPSTISVWPRTISASGELRNATAPAMSSGVTMRPAALRSPSREHLLPVREMVEGARVDDAARDGVDADPRRPELDGEVAHERLERGLRGADEGVVLRAPGTEPRLEIATTDEPAGIAGAITRVSARSERAFAFSVQSQCLSSVSSAGPDHARRRVVDEDVERPERPDLLEHALGGDVAPDEHRLGAERAQLVRRLLGGRVRAHVADRDPGGAVAGEAEGDRLADPARAARDEDRPSHQAVLHQPARGSGRVAGADDGSSSQPIRVRGSSGSSSSAFDDA